ncbi:ATP-binding protein [Pontixanthobacter aestiaquae]|uniref:histidine kinase n=1 Tax=Pontixanthobacter aestiaquae TaxID=1509367 RepID=A0A844Z8G9_9SPHN|nr:ATP-binding protein [Pontixanthobacter aestiaquae]MDN3645387.1 ATP-binding protein [Pontixanthobacter aestiaquae]MXO83612.1 PAS domain-containing protein [Pontixanthobacter aestiaquae]
MADERSDTRPNARAQISGFIFAMLLLDDDLVVAEANHAAEDILGRSAKRLVGSKLADLIDLSESGVAGRLDDQDAQLVARGVPALIGEQSRVLNITISPLPSHPGWRVLTLSDAGQDDMKSSDEPDASLKAPAILAHEIKNPLAAIRGASQLVARKLDEKDRGLTTIISDEVDRIAGLIDRMQELGSKSSEPVEAINLHHSVRNAMASVRAAAKDRAELIEEFDPSLPEVSASGASLEQVLINLLSNAVDACAGQEAPRVTVRTRFVSGLASNVFRLSRSVRLPIEVSVVDNGSGLDESLGDHIFEPFVTSKPNGQGLGLALVKKLVTDMGGRVSCKRDDAAGETIFRLHLAVAERAQNRNMS